MPAAASENTPRRFFGRALANRRWCERPAAVRPDRRGANEADKALFRQDGRQLQTARQGSILRRSNPARIAELTGRSDRVGTAGRRDRVLRGSTARLTGPIAGCFCRLRPCRSGTPQGAERPTGTTGATFATIRSPKGGWKLPGPMRRASRCSSTSGCGTHSRCSGKHHRGHASGPKRDRPVGFGRWNEADAAKTATEGDSGAGSDAGPILFRAFPGHPRLARWRYRSRAAGEATAYRFPPEQETLSRRHAAARSGAPGQRAPILAASLRQQRRHAPAA